jgi:transposase-like protein
MVAGLLGRRVLQVEAMPTDAAGDITAFADFPAAYWKKIWSTNPLERLIRGVKRRADLVGAFPDPAALAAWTTLSWLNNTMNGKRPATPQSAGPQAAFPTCPTTGR